MPEIKNQFTGGKMNKDVDERLVPKGEYRDAMNIQVSTSEGSDVGTVQNILGNSAVVADLGIDPGSICVGAVADEKNDALYWFMREPTVVFGSLTVSQSRDIIFELKSGGVREVFVDQKQVMIAVDDLLNPASGNIVINSQTGFNAISVGDTFQVWDNGVNVSGNDTYTVESKDYSGNLQINIGNYSNAPWAYTVVQGGGQLQLLLSHGNVLKFPSKIITGINIIDDMLFWTDGITEPKKINIPRSIAGTASGNFHTRLINLDQNINYASNVLIEEKHITVIRKSPLKPPTLSQITSFRLGTTSGVTNSLNFANVSGDLLNEGDTIFIDIVYDASDPAPNIEVGDTLRLLESGIENLPPNHYTARVLITEITPGAGLTTYKTTISTLSSENPIGPIVYEFALEEEGGELFKRKFPRFAYRYKYIDNEYSAIGPFSEVAFVPGSFQYDPTEAYNKGMVNNLKELTLQNFIPSDIPEDVIQVDLLYKNETSPNIYVIKSVVNTDAAWDLGGSYEVRTENIYATLPSNQLLRAWDNVPKNALAQEITGNRIVYGNYTQGYDYSNSKALYSPEIEASISNRLNKVGGNIAAKSIKSSRTYDFGVVYGDEHNRETPVLTVSSATKVVPKSKSSNSNSINISLEENPPLWAEYCKVFVKETSNEYYNLAVDRVYDAEDGNVWVSFPSVDRNKIDEDTYIVLKKGIDNSEAVLEEARYKVVAIKNEAPDYIKTSYTLISEPNQNITGHNLLGGNGNYLPVQSPVEAPEVGHSSFTINKNLWNNPYSTIAPIAMGLVNLSEFISELEAGEDLYVAFSNRVVDDPDGAGPGSPTYTRRVSDKYLVIGIDINTDGGNTAPTPPATTPPPSNTGGSDLFEVHLSKPIPQSDDWLVTSINETYSNGGQLKPHFYRQRVINKPEFDGRFFVKIEEDQVIRDKVKPFEDPGLDWKVVASNNLYHLIDHDVSTTGQNLAPVTGNTGGSGAGGYGASKTQVQWEDNLKFGSSGGPRAGWFIDHAFYAAKQPGSNDNIINSISEGPDPSLFPSFSGSDDWSDQTTGTAAAGLVLSGQIAEVGKSNGVVHSDGLYTHPITSELYFHLSYSILESDQNYTNFNDNWTVGKNDSSLSNYYPNTHTEDQTAFVSNLKAGKYFRIKGNDSVYIITDAYWERLYNYTGHYPIHNSGPVTSSELIQQMTGDANKRLRWTIKYELYGAGDSLATNNKFTAINNNTAGTLEFLQPFTAEQPNDISTNPAIFETEPKEDTDLDIYYETANSTPLEFTTANREQFIPIGSTLDFEDANYLINNSIPEDLSVIGWGPSANWPTATALVETSVVLSHEIPIGSIPSTLKFVRPDGSWVEAVITGGPTTAGNAGIVGFTISSFTKNIGLAWFNCWSFNNGVESNRIGDTFNKPFITNGVKVSTPLLDQYKQETRKYGLIYSGIYNSTSGTNNLNQFIAAEKITKDINPIYGSIQKLHSGWGQGGDLVALCEDRVLKILANKDALFNADGNSNITSTNNVLGQAIPYSGEYGISRNPESFASEAYRIYFTDKVRGTVMRLSMDGLTPISNHGMKDWFRDNLKLNSTILGSYDDKKDEYNVTLQQTDDVKRNNNPVTVTFREDAKGWVSFKSFTPENAISCANEYYTFKNANIWKHHDESVPRNTFHNEGQSNSTLNVILNDMPGSVKSFNTINYEGSQSRVVPNLQDNQYYNLASKPGWYVDSIFTNKESGSLEEFIEKEGKWFNYIKGKEIQHSGNNIIVNPDGISSFDQASFAIQGLGILGGDPTGGFVYGCTDPVAFNYNPNATADDGSCEPVVYGCLEATADNTCNNNCNTEDGSCQWSGCCCQGQYFPTGCTNTDPFTEAHAYYAIWQSSGFKICEDLTGGCTAVISGCMDSTAFNYDSSANVDDGSCIAVYEGCTEPTANENYNQLANTEDGTCIWRGCTDDTTPANNYLWEGPNVDDLATSQGWNTATLVAGGNATGYFPVSSAYGMLDTNSTICTYDTGCMDPLADNTDAGATEDDGSCEYCGEWADGELYGGVQGYSTPSYGITITHETYQGYDDGTIEISMPSGTSIPPAAPGYMVMLLQSGGYPASASSGAIAYINSSYTTAYFYGIPPGEYYFQITQGPGEFVGNQYAACSFNSHTSGVGVYGMDVNVGPDPNGCMDATACNYDAVAIFDDGSCILPGCDDINAIDGDPALGGCGCTAGDTGCCDYTPQPIQGCLDDGTGGGAMYSGIAACNYGGPGNTNGIFPYVTSDDGSCNYATCAGCLDNRQNNAQSGYASSTYALDTNSTAYNADATIHDQSQCVYNYDMSTNLSGQLASNNFVGNDSTSPNWTDEFLTGPGVSKTFVAAVFDVSNAPPIRFPGYNAAGVYAPTQTSSRETKFSWNMPGYTSDWSNGVAGDITTEYGFSTTSPTLDWLYSNDNGATWSNGASWNYGDPVKLVKFHMFTSANESSGVLDWGTYPYGYNGKIYQNAKFGFTDVVWNGNPIPLNDDGACAGNNSCPDWHVTETSESKTIITGCTQAGYCNTSGAYGFTSNANWPTDPSNNPCGGTPGCNIAAACNYNPNADCNDNSCSTPNTKYFYSANGCGTASGNCEVCYGVNLCAPYNNTCHGSTYYNDINACQTANMSGCTTSTACNYDDCAVVDDGSCIVPTASYYENYNIGSGSCTACNLGSTCGTLPQCAASGNVSLGGYTWSEAACNSATGGN